MSKRKYRVDICPECKVKEGVSSRKRLYQCNQCERWFCKKHLEPRIAGIPVLSEVIKDSAWQNLIEKERRRKEGHPDFQYTKVKWQELKIERELAWANMKALLDGVRIYGKGEVAKSAKEEKIKELKELKPEKTLPYAEPKKQVANRKILVSLILVICLLTTLLIGTSIMFRIQISSLNKENKRLEKEVSQLSSDIETMRTRWNTK